MNGQEMDVQAPEGVDRLDEPGITHFSSLSKSRRAVNTVKHLYNGHLIAGPDCRIFYENDLYTI